MNNYELNETIPCEAVKEEAISDIIREDSSKIRNIFDSLCKVRQFIDGTSGERSMSDKEPSNMLEEVLWQRSMLERMDQELYQIEHKLGLH